MKHWTDYMPIAEAEKLASLCGIETLNRDRDRRAFIGDVLLHLISCDRNGIPRIRSRGFVGGVGFDTAIDFFNMCHDAMRRAVIDDYSNERLNNTKSDTGCLLSVGAGPRHGA